MGWERLPRAALGVGFMFLANVATPAHARITRMEISTVQSPTFEGISFGAGGQYEKLIGRFLARLILLIP